VRSIVLSNTRRSRAKRELFAVLARTRARVDFTKPLIIDVLIVCLFGLLALSWFRGDYLICGGDSWFFPDRFRSFMRTFYVWDSTQGTGALNTRIIAGSIPYEALRMLSKIVGLSLVDAQKLWFYLCFATSGLSMYYLISIFVNWKNRRVACLTGGMIYMMNEYVALFLIPDFYFFNFYSFLPLILGLYIKGIRENKNVTYAFLLCCVWIITTNSIFVDPVFAVSEWAVIVLFLMYRVLVLGNRSECKRAIRFTFSFGLIWMGLNAYWIVPDVFYAAEALEQVSIAFSLTSRPQVLSGQGVYLFDIFRLSGFWALRSSYRGEPYFYWAALYSSPLFTSLSLLLPLLSFAALLFERRNKGVAFFALLASIGILLINGTNQPARLLIWWWLTYIPLALEFFSNLYFRFGYFIALSYSFLTGISIGSLWEGADHIRETRPIFRNSQAKEFKRPKMIRMLVVLTLLFLLIGVYGMRFWNGDVVRPEGSHLPSPRTRIPEYYNLAREWLGGGYEFRIYPIPYPVLGYNFFSWDSGFAGPDPTESILGVQVLEGVHGGGEIGRLVAQQIASNDTAGVAAMLALLNVRYVLFHRDSRWEYVLDNPWFVFPPPEKIDSILDRIESFRVEKDFDRLRFYRNENWRPMQIYATSAASFVSGGTREMLHFLGTDNVEPSDMVFFLTEQLTPEEYRRLGELLGVTRVSTRPHIEFVRTSPVEYRLRIVAFEPFFLVLSESYHRDWTAFLSSNKIEDHFIGNGYANVWYIGEIGSYEVVIQFLGQSTFYYGSAISLLTLTLCIIPIARKRFQA